MLFKLHWRGVESTATTRIGDSVLLPATLLDLRKQNTLVTTYLPTSSTPKNSTNTTFTSQSQKQNCSQNLHSLRQRTNLQIHQKEHPQKKQRNTHTHTQLQQKQYLETSLYKTTRGYLAKKIQLRIISQTSLLPSSSSSSSCSRFTMICEILQPSPSPHPKEATESFLSLPNPSRPVGSEPKHQIKPSHHLERLLGGDGRGDNTRSRRNVCVGTTVSDTYKKNWLPVCWLCSH